MQETNKLIENLKWLRTLQPDFYVAKCNPQTNKPSRWQLLSSVPEKEWQELRFRQQLACELLLEIDGKNLQESEAIFSKHIKPALIKHKFGYLCFSTFSKSLHIHLFFKKEINNKLRKRLIEELFSNEVISKLDDSFWTKSRQMLALEYAPHYRSGKPKELIEKRKPIVNEIPAWLKAKSQTQTNGRVVDKTTAEILANPEATEQERVACVMNLYEYYGRAWSVEDIVQYLKKHARWSDFDEGITRKKVAKILEKYGHRSNPNRPTTQNKPNRDWKKQYVLNVLLNEEKKPPLRLGQGVTRIDGERTFFFGTTLYFDGKPISAIVTDKRNILLGGEINKFEDEIKSKAGAYIPFDERLIDSCGVWSNKSIRAWLEGRENTRELSEIINELVEIARKHIWLTDDSEYILLACYSAGTYCFTLFEQFPRLVFYGHSGAGKTTACRLLRYATFNPIWVSQATQSSLFRSVEATCGTLICDNFDSLSVEAKELLLHFFITGSSSDGVFRLAEPAKKKGRFTVKAFYVYSPLVLNSIIPLGAEAAENRSICIRMQQCDKALPKIAESKERLHTLGEELRLWTLKNWRLIEETRDNLNTDLFGRRGDVWIPLLTIAKVAGDSYYQALKNLAEKKIKESQAILSNQEERNKTILRLILEQFQESEKSTTIRLKDLADELAKNELGINPEDERDLRLLKAKHRYYFSIVKNFLMGLPQIYKPERISRPQGYESLLVYKQDLISIIRARGWKDLLNEFHLHDYASEFSEQGEQGE
ncbi:MAG: hypothetical protein DRO07_01595 [Candidatus Iainarchaeum archaeon]|uniref:DUF3631 domain-containing protein n=1 Tax=Candidatus Iainarchaeum sp. TaxID=3101447 RepID=A0A497JFV4_9ARCH|nr:MAG: hypothetical protein DRO07_01595 [Candidatus Diapherotrites archaeon]